MSHFGASRVDSLVAAKSAVVVDLFGEDAAQLKQQLGLEHAISVDLAFHLKEETVELK